jgi:BON domain
MPNPIDVITKPLQIGAQVATRTIEEVVKRFAGGEDEPPRTEPREEQPAPPPKRPPKPKPLDDVTITRKVETVLFRQESVDKGKVSVSTAKGVVTLRGEAKTPELIKALEATTRQIPEVREVENLLHLPKTPARRPRRPKQTPKPTPKRTTAERPPTTPAAEPSPKEVAARGEGRRPAPLGSQDDGA